MADFSRDDRIVLTLDAGGTNFDFSAIQGNKEIADQVRLASNGDNLEKCIQTIKDGFNRLLPAAGKKPVAISFAFPGPADYQQGIIGNLNNLPAFRGGVPLKSILEKEFRLPVFINNDADLFTYGEALCGILPKVNKMLTDAGSPKSYHNLIGLTLGTGFGGGVVSNGVLLGGDNSMASEIWLSSSRLSPSLNAEEAISIRAIKREYAIAAGLPLLESPSPKDIASIARGELEGNKEAAQMAYRKMGAFIGDVMANLMTLLDGLVVIGGGIAYANELFFPAIEEQLYSCFEIGEKTIPRIVQRVYNLQDNKQVSEFLKPQHQTVKWEGIEEMSYNPHPALAYGVTTLGTRKATALGAYAYALSQLK